MDLPVLYAEKDPGDWPGGSRGIDLRHYPSLLDVLERLDLILRTDIRVGDRGQFGFTIGQVPPVDGATGVQASPVFTEVGKLDRFCETHAAEYAVVAAGMASSGLPKQGQWFWEQADSEPLG